MKFSITALTLAMAAYANAHGYFKSPPARLPGPGFKAECGDNAWYAMKGDINGNIQGMQNQIPAEKFAEGRCKIDKCKGMKWMDNKDRVQTYRQGQVVPMEFDITAPHSGYANVSIINLEFNTVMATLKTWDKYALTENSDFTGMEKFSVTIPDLKGKCVIAGRCAIQMFWHAPKNVDQTYESCIDFKLAGNGKRDAVEERMHTRDFHYIDEGLL